MAEPPSSPQTLNPNPQPSESDKSSAQPASATPPPALAAPTPTPAPAPAPAPAPPPSFAPPISGAAISAPPVAPSFRPAGPPQFSPLPGAFGFHNPGLPPPGISSAPGMVAGGVIPAVPPPMVAYQVPAPGQPPNPALRQYMPMPNGYAPMPGAPQPPPGIPSYSPYPGMIRPAFAPRPPGPLGVLPAISRPPVPVVPGVRPIIPPIVRPALVPVTPAEKPQTTVYVGKIAPSVENDYMLSLLRLCGPVKSWKRAQDPSNGAPKGFGFCEFESAEGVLRALRLLSKLNIDGQELVLNVNQATREYLERYVEKKRENAKKLNESEVAVVAEKESDGASNAEKNESLEASGDDSKKDDLKNDDSDSGKKESHDNAPFGIVTDEDREADKEASQKLTSMIEERLKTKPLPPPPPQVPADILAIAGSEAPAKSDSDADPIKNDAEDRNDEETTSDNKTTSEHDKTEINSPDRNRRYDRRSRERDRERDVVKREKEREVERYEREAERERIRKEREQRRKIEEAEREYEERLKDWEYREREKEKQRQYDRERDKERERKRKKEIIYDEEDEEEDSRKRWHRSVLEEKRKKRLREKEDDLADRRKEEEEIAEAKKRAEEEKMQQLQQQREALKLLNGDIASRHEKSVQAEESRGEIVQHGIGDIAGHEYPAGDGISRIGVGDNSVITMAASEVQQNNNAPAKKLGFGLVGSGKRTAVPSVFYEEDDDDRNKEKKLRPLVPIDYSTEEMQAIQTPPGQSQPNLAAAAEFAKQLSTANMKEEKPESERERSRRSHDRSSQREKDRTSLDGNRVKDENRDKNLERGRVREHGPEKLKTTDNKKLLDAKQLIDMIPRTKEDLFSYEINWALYDQHELHERMRPWISKKIMEFLGEEETSLVDYIVTSTREHVKATEMLETLKSILDEEAEMFVLKMWRMLIFEIKKVETGLHLRSRS